MMRMTRLDVVYESKLIRKFQKWLYYLHMNPIATRRNVKSDFRIQPRNVIVRAQKTVSTEYKIKFPFKRKACQVYRVGYGRGRIW